MEKKKNNEKKVYKKYNLFGLSISSSIPIEMIGKKGKKSREKGDVHITEGRIKNEGGKENLKRSGHYMDGSSMFYAVKEVGWFMIKKGKKIVVDKLKKADKNVVELYLIGLCMATVLRQRGYVVFHGSCIKKDDVAILFAGPQGSGKSTLAAASTKCGAKIISDDISPVWVTPSGDVKVAPGHPQVKLWPESIDMLKYDKSKSKRLHKDVKKRYVIMDESVASSPLSLDAFCEISKGGGFSVKGMTGGKALESVCRNLFLRRIPQLPEEEAHQFREMGKIIEGVDVYDLQRSRRDSPLETFAKIEDRLG